MESCPTCGRNNFKSKSGFTLHVKGCKGAADKIAEKPKKKRTKNTATLEDFERFRKILLEVADRMYENVEDLKRMADIADTVGHDGFAVWCRYFADTRIRAHIEDIVGYSGLYTESAYKRGKEPKPWE